MTKILTSSPEQVIKTGGVLYKLSLITLHYITSHFKKFLVIHYH